jgi:DNA-binding GntR family transcriptional regulator
VADVAAGAGPTGPPEPPGTTYDEPRRRARRPRLSDEVASHVREQIVSGLLRPGEFIRPEKVAEEVGVSATPAREGLLALQSEGFLRVEPRRGFVVAPLSRADIADTFEAQALLGGELTARAASVADADFVDGLVALQGRLREAASRGGLDEVEELNFAFHRAIYRRAGSPKLSWLLRATLGYAPRRLWATVEGWPDLTVHDHEEVLDALRARDPERARAAMAGHIRAAGQALLDHVAPEGR